MWFVFGQLSRGFHVAAVTRRERWLVGWTQRFCPRSKQHCVTIDRRGDALRRFAEVGESVKDPAFYYQKQRRRRRLSLLEAMRRRGEENRPQQH